MIMKLQGMKVEKEIQIKVHGKYQKAWFPNV